MISRHKEFEVCCDAPPYDVVRACKGCGFHNPLDVRWCRLSHFLEGEGQQKRFIGIRLWQRLFGKSISWAKTCTCGQPLPDLKQYAVIFQSKAVGDYQLGQCRRCGTIFWDEAIPLPAWLEMAGLS